MKRVLIIDENEEFREYLRKKIGEYGFDVASGANGLDGSLKLRKIIPDLIIMDTSLTKKPCHEVLKEKEENPNTAAIPIVMLTNKIGRRKIAEYGRYGVKKIFFKPIKIDSLLRGISEILGTIFEVDDTPCIVEANFNNEIIFVEIARGLNIEKIEILRFRLEELVSFYSIAVPKLLLMLSGTVIEDKTIYKIRTLLDIVLKTVKGDFTKIIVLTNEETVKDYIECVPEYKSIQIRNNLSDALDDLIGQKADNFAQGVIEGNLLMSKAVGGGVREKRVEMRFETESLTRQLETISSNARIAVVDDDFVIRQLIKTVFKAFEWKIDMYENGKLFIDALSGNEGYDLIFLDIMMPEVDGFGVLDFLNQKKIKTPVIMFSALSEKEAVQKAVKYGVKSYMGKPLNPDLIKRKTAETLNPGF